MIDVPAMFTLSVVYVTTDAMPSCPSWESNGFQVFELVSAPRRWTVLTVPHLAPCIMSAEAYLQCVQARAGLLHEHDIWIVCLNQPRDIVRLRSGSVQQVPT